MVRIDKDLNPLEVLVVQNDIEKNHNVTDYTLAKGNGCIWAYYGMINSYYVFKDGKLIDVIYD